MAENSTPGYRAWTDPLKDRVNQKITAASDATKAAVVQRLEPYQTQISAAGTAYCATQRSDLYYFSYGLGFASGALLVGVIAFAVYRLKLSPRRPTVTIPPSKHPDPMMNTIGTGPL